MNSSPMSSCRSLNNPNIQVCPKLTGQPYRQIELTIQVNKAKGGIRAEIVILTDIRFDLNASLLSLKTYLGVKKVMWHVNNLQLQILFNT